MQTLLDRLRSFGTPRIALIGDFMIDRWVYGHANRLSQEAPVPVLRKVSQKTTTGGAGNIAEAIAALGGMAVCIGAIGKDEEANLLVQLLSQAGADSSKLIRLPDRRTTIKTRYVGLAQHRHAQQMFRVDDEVTEPLSDEVMATIKSALRGELSDCKVLALEDYNKGVFSNAHTPQMIADARKAGCMVIVDPAPISDYSRYRGATILTPNRFKTALASGIEIVDDASLDRAAKEIMLTTDCDAILITLDKEGSYLATRDGNSRRIVQPHPRKVYDVTGAGDEVLAALAVALAEGSDFDEAAALANVAGGLEVERFGVVPITKREMMDELQRMIGLRTSKLTDRACLAEELVRRRQQGETIVFTNGCFDLLHMGHVRYLQEARQQGACLIVAINSDKSVSRLKGPDRPIIGEIERAEMLSALECVDYVTIFEEDTPESLLETLHPDILVKGGSTPVVVGQELVEQYGGLVKRLSLVEGQSTTNIIDRILASHEPKEE